MNDNIIAWIPVNGRRDAIFIRCLQGINNTQQLSGVSACGSWVSEDQANDFLRVDDENRADGEGDAAGVDVRGVLVVEPSCDISPGFIFILGK